VDHGQFDRFEAQQLDGPDYFKKEVRTAAQMTYPELKRYITDLKRSGFDVSTLMVDIYRKLSFPLVSFIMAIIGILFSLTTGYDRQKRRVLRDWRVPRYRNLQFVCV